MDIQETMQNNEKHSEERGEEHGIAKAAKALKADGVYSDEQISRLLNIPLDDVKAL